MKKTFLDLTYIRDPRLPKKLSLKPHLVFNADCDDLPFTIFPEMPGYQTMYKMMYLGITSCKCEIKWKYLNNNYNRCEGIEFPYDFVKHIQHLFKSKNGK